MKGIFFPLYISWTTLTLDHYNLVKIKVDNPDCDIIAIGNLGNTWSTVKYSSAFQSTIDFYHKYGVKVAYYIYTSSFDVTVSDINNWTDTILSWYPNIDYIFFDEWGNSGDGGYTAKTLSQCQSIMQHVRLITDKLVIANGHGHNSDWYTLPNAPDYMMSLESPGSTPSAVLSAAYNDYILAPLPSNRKFMGCNGTTPSEWSDSQLKQFFEYADYIYLNDRYSSVAYQGLPSWLNRQAQIAASINGSKLKIKCSTKTISLGDLVK